MPKNFTTLFHLFFENIKWDISSLNYYGKVSLATTETNELVAIKTLNIIKLKFKGIALQNILDEIQSLTLLSGSCNDIVPALIEYY